MTNLDPITLLKQEFDIKLRTLAAELTDTLDQIHVAMQGITRTCTMALQSLQADIGKLEERLNGHIASSPDKGAEGQGGKNTGISEENRSANAETEGDNRAETPTVPSPIRDGREL